MQVSIVWWWCGTNGSLFSLTVVMGVGNLWVFWRVPLPLFTKTHILSREYYGLPWGFFQQPTSANICACICYTLGHISVHMLLLYFYFAFMCTTRLITVPTGLISAVATISILSSYILIWPTLSDLLILSHFLTHVSPFLLTPLDSLFIDMCTCESVPVHLTHSLLLSTCHLSKYLLVHF